MDKALFLNKTSKITWNSQKTLKLGVFLAMTAHILIVVFPFLWLTYSSLKTNKEFLASVWKLPETLRWENYFTAWGQGALGVYTVNSVIITIFSVAFIVGIATLAGYSLGVYRRMQWMPRAETMFIIAMTMPAYVSLIPIVQTMRGLNLLDTRLGLILPTIAFNIPMSIFIMKSFFVTVPHEIIEAAKIDGASELRIFSSVVLPLAKPAMFTTAIINVIWVWNDFLFPLVLINSPKRKTLPVGLTDYVGEHITNYPVMMAAILIASLGAFLMYLIFQKQVIGGLMGGAVKE
jgi:raffinose/stachyose/melibiose transport system permease protein